MCVDNCIQIEYFLDFWHNFQELPRINVVCTHLFSTMLSREQDISRNPISIPTKKENNLVMSHSFSRRKRPIAERTQSRFRSVSFSHKVTKNVRFCWLNLIPFYLLDRHRHLYTQLITEIEMKTDVSG